MADQKLTVRVHHTTMKSGIRPSPEFEGKGLASSAANIGRACGHDCLYCSSKAVLRRLPIFRELGEDPFGHGYCIFDPNAPAVMAEDARRIKRRGMVQLCTLTDAWAPACQPHKLGRRCLEAILQQPGWTVRILTKNAAVQEDFEWIANNYRDRVLVGLSITATPDRDPVISVLEPHASPISERMAVLRKASSMGLRTYAMFCPLMPGICDQPNQIDRLVQFAGECKAEQVFVEPVNSRGRGLIDCQMAMESHGHAKEASAFAVIRARRGWSGYVAQLAATVQRSMLAYSDLSKLRFLLYPSALTPEDAATIRQNDEGIVWLGEIPESPAVDLERQISH